MLSYEIREKIIQVIESTITIEQFEDWLVPRLPTFLKSPDRTDSNVIAAVELGLAEMSDGVRTKDEFRSFLRDVLQEQTAMLVFSPSRLSQWNKTGSANQTASPPTARTMYSTARIIEVSTSVVRPRQ